MHRISPYPSELARSILSVEALNPKINDAIPRAMPIPSNTLFVISPLSALANVAIAPGIKYFLILPIAKATASNGFIN